MIKNEKLQYSINVELVPHKCSLVLFTAREQCHVFCYLVQWKPEKITLFVQLLANTITQILSKSWVQGLLYAAPNSPTCCLHVKVAPQFVRVFHCACITASSVIATIFCSLQCDQFACKFKTLTNTLLLMKLIRSGKIDDAFDKLREWYPQIFKVVVSSYMHYWLMVMIIIFVFYYHLSLLLLCLSFLCP